MSLFDLLERTLKINVREHAKNSSFLLTSSLIVSLFGVGISILYANLLSKEVYGDYRYVLGLLNVFNSLSLTGMNVAVTQAIARGFDSVFASAIRYQLKWAIPHTLIGLFAAGIFYTQNNILAALSLLIIAFILPISNAFNTYTAFLQGKKFFGIFSAATIVQNTLVYGAIALAVITTRNVLWITFASLSTALVINIVMYLWTLKRFQQNKEQDPKAITYGRNTSFLWGIRLAAEQIDTFLIHGLLGPAQLATYAVITTIPERLKGFIKIAPTVALPNHANRNLTEIVPLLRKKMLLLLLGLGILSLFYVWLCPYVFGWIYPLYPEAITLAQLYGTSLIFGSSTIPLSILFSQQESTVLGKVLAGSSIVQGLIMASGLLLGGLIGAIIGRLLFQGLQTLSLWLGLEYATKHQSVRAIIK